MDPRSASHVLTRIAELLELQGVDRFRARAYTTAARAIVALRTDDICPLFRSGELAELRGVGPATLGVIGELCATGESSYLERLSADVPPGLLEMLRVPGLGRAKLHHIHRELGIATVDELEQAARDGRLSSLSGFGPKTVDKLLRGIGKLRERESYSLFHRAQAEAQHLLDAVMAEPGVETADIAGDVRRRSEVVCGIDIVAACHEPPPAVAAAFAEQPGVAESSGMGGRSVDIRFVDGVRLRLHCAELGQYPVALWRATGSAAHEQAVLDHAHARGFTITEDVLRAPDGRTVGLPDERAFYESLGLEFVPPELREGQGEVEAAARQELPELVQLGDLRGVLHCHSEYSDGSGTIAELAEAARARGWEYLGISDHSRAAFYAGGLSPDAVLRQHDDIDRVNEALAATGFRVLKGIEADILVDGSIDYEPAILERFDYVIGSVHSRFALERDAMTERVLRAMDSPYLTVLGHPTGRLLLSREPYAIDMDAVIQRAAERGVAIELNADPHRLDLDWRLCRVARAQGVSIAIGPDAHSAGGLDNVVFGIGIARKGWLRASDVLNTRPAGEILARARARRAGA